MSYESLLNIKNMLHEGFESAVNARLITKNPVNGVIPQKDVPHEQRVLCDDESMITKDYALKHDNVIANAVLLLLNTGMRKGELLGLRLDDVDIDNGVIHVRNSLKRIKHPSKYQRKNYILVSNSPVNETKTGIYLGPPKSLKSIRNHSSRQ